MSIIKTDGFIKQSGITTTTTVQLHIPFTTTYYHVNLTKGPGSAYPLLLYLDTKTTTQFFINNYQNRYDGLWQAEGY